MSRVVVSADLILTVASKICSLFLLPGQSALY